jgi:hypothetical protein
MQSDNWIALLQKVPPAYHDSLMVVTSVGLEVSIQAIMRVEEQYLVVRGRVAGTTDTGRTFFIPFDQINFLCVQKPLKEAEIGAMFGEPAGQSEAEGTLPAGGLSRPEVAEDLDKPQSQLEDQPPLPAKEPPKQPAPPRWSRSELLARIRSRSQGTAAGSPDMNQ